MKYIVITGASSGIGYELALRYANTKTHLILLARRKEKLEELSLLCQKKGAIVDIYCVDMADCDSVIKTALTIIDKIPFIDRIILNAGMSLGHKADITPFSDYEYLWKVNFLSNHALLEPFIPLLQKQKSGHIVFISSLASIITMPSSIAYSSSKRALNAYAEGLRYKLLPFNVDVSIIKPGFIKSELTDKNQFKMPFILPLDKGVDNIFNAIKKRKVSYAFPKRFFYLISFLNLLPQFIKDKIILKKNISKN